VNPSECILFRVLMDIDSRRCCGTHLSQTSHLSILLLHHTQYIRAGNCRLYFIAGDRAIDFASSSIHCQQEISKLLSSEPVPEKVLEHTRKLTEAVVNANRKNKKMLMEIAKIEADRAKSVMRSGKNAFVHRIEDGLDFINMVVFELRDAMRETNQLALLASGKRGAGGHVVVLGEEASIQDIIPNLKTLITSIKGGGKGGRWQGKIIEWKAGELETLKGLIEA